MPMVPVTLVEPISEETHDRDRALSAFVLLDFGEFLGAGDGGIVHILGEVHAELGLLVSG